MDTVGEAPVFACRHQGGPPVKTLCSFLVRYEDELII